MPPRSRSRQNSRQASRSRAKPASRSGQRCVFVEPGGRRCQRNGFGDPPLCRACRIAAEELARSRPAGMPRSALGDLLESLLHGKKIDPRTFVGAAAEVFGGYVRYRATTVDANGRRTTTGGAGAWPFGGTPDPRQTPPPRVDPEITARRRAQIAARKTLGFDVAETLDRDKIKTRQRELARKHHPDLPGGSTERMAAINAAADLLVQATA